MKKKLTILSLDKKVNEKLAKASKDFPDMADYLEEMHKIIDWAEMELKKIK